MADAQPVEDLGFKPIAAPIAANDDFGFKPIAPPVLPDTSGLQKTVQDNLSKQQEGEGEQKPQSPSERLDTGLGMPVSQILSSGTKDTPLPPEIRGHLMDAYKAGTAVNAGDYMQTALPAAANAVNPINHYAQEAGRDILQAATFINPYTLGAHLFDIPLQAGSLATQFALEHTPEGSAFHIQSGSQYNAPPTFGALFDQIGEKLFPQGAPQSETAKLVDTAITFGGAGAVAKAPSLALKAWNTFTGVALGAGGQVSQEKAEQWAKQNFPDSPVIQSGISQAAGLLAMVGVGGTLHAAGHEALKPMVANIIQKPVDSVTPQDINQTISKGFENAAPKAQDFHDVVAAIDHNNEPPPPPAAGSVGVLKQPDQALYDFPKKPLSLADFVRKNGGINDEGGDVRSMLGGAKYRPGLVNSAGKSLDDMALASHEAGFFPEKGEERPSINEFKEKLNEDLSGNPQHSQHDIEASQAYEAALRKNAEVDRISNETGIDTKGKTHQQFWDEVSKHLTFEDVGAKIDDFTRRAEENSKSWYTEALEPEEKEARELENARQQKQTTEAKSIISTGIGESGLISGTAEQGQASSGRIGGGIESSGSANERGNAASTADTLRLIYSETGVRPEQVFEDIKTNPDVASDIKNGKVPNAYRQSGGGGNGGGPPNKPPSQEPAPGKQPRSNEGASSRATNINFPRVLFDPAHISEAAQDMATSIRQAAGPRDQAIAQTGSSLKKYIRIVNALSKDEQLNFIHYMENEGKGATAPTDIPDNLKPLAEELRFVYDEMHKQANDAGIDIGYLEGYHPHEYEDEKAYENFYNDWIAKQGGTRNLKERIFPTLQEAMEYGLKPKTTNPIEAAMKYVSNMGNLIAAHKVIKAATEAGVAYFFVKGNQPEGWVPLNGNLNEQSYVPEGSNTGESISKILYAPEDAARVYNNDISNQTTSPFDTVADFVQRASNFATKSVLALSGYHSVLTALSSTASDLGRALTGGTLAERASDVAHAIVPGLDVYKGGKLLNAYLGREQLPEGLQKALDLAVKNNTINPVQQDYWKATAAGDFWDTFRDGGIQGLVKEAKETASEIKQKPVTGTLKAIANGFGRTLDTLTHPIFDYQVPRLKIAANISELHDWIQSHPDATSQEQDRAAQAIGDSIDNRFGEMMRDNLFWHKWTRDSMQLTFLSYSWVAGALRMVKGIPDTGAWILSRGKEDLSPNAKYLFGAASAYALANSMMTYYKTGKGPDDWKDLLTYKTGGTTPQGTPERALLPSHIGQFMHYIHDGLTGELANELSPLLKLAMALRSNKDYRELPITNENNSWFTAQPWKDYLQYIGQNEEPMGAKNITQGEKRGSKITKLEQFMGDRPAPEFFAAPDAYDRMMKNINSKAWQKRMRSDRHLQEQYSETRE